MRRTHIWRWAIVASALTLAAGCESAEQKSIARSNALVESMRQRSIPGLPAAISDAQALDIDKARSGKGGWFVETGCFACHNVSVYGVKAMVPTGPDLAIAAADVQTRFGMSLDEFWRQPTGMMMIVRSQMIKLSPEEEAKALHLLKEAYEEYQEHQREKK
jgi:hypothetical protein